MFDIVIGRDKKTYEKFKTKGSIFIGKQYIKMGQYTSLSNNVYLDVATSHVVFICGKRGSGKSYTMGVISEGIADLPYEIKQNLSVVILDTMGIYWTMKFPNKEDEALLEEWNLKPKSLDIKIFTPKGYFDKFKKEGVPTDYPFSIKPSDLSPIDWCHLFSIDQNSSLGVVIEKTIFDIKKKLKDYDLNDIINYISSLNIEFNLKQGVINRFENAKHWGLFDINGTKLEEIIKPGQVSVIDVSCYATIQGAEGIKALAIGLIAHKLFQERMVYRRKEEFEELYSMLNYFSEEEVKKLEKPMVWLIIDEAHEFLPREGVTGASDSLITILREGRQPGISLVLATQQPGKIHTDVMTQSDVVIAHRLTAKIDIDALGLLMQSYMRHGLDKMIDSLPPEKGAAVIFDDKNEKMFPIRIRPRFSWHGGSAPFAIKEKKELFKF